jgi:hypothetical protein
VRLDGLGQEVQHVPALKAARHAHRHDPLDEEVASLALGTVAVLPPEDPGPHRTLAGVVGRLDTGAVHERPHRVEQLDDVLARLLGLRVTAARSETEEAHGEVEVEAEVVDSTPDPLAAPGMSLRFLSVRHGAESLSAFLETTTNAY